MVATKAAVLVRHRGSGRAYSYNEKWELLEPLIFTEDEPNYKSVRCWWRPMTAVPAWAVGIRDLQFDTFFLT